MFAPMTHPTFDEVLPPDGVFHRFVMDKYGSKFMPGVGRLTLAPAPAMIVVVFGTVTSP
jgi:hypothetical protein